MGREQVSELLVAAALRGTKQIYGRVKTDEGMCALGVLLDALPQPWRRSDLMPTVHFKEGQLDLICRAYGLTEKERAHIVYMNDHHKLDFLTIARKWENPDNA